MRVAVFGDGHTRDILHDKVGRAVLGGARVQHFGDCRLVHQSQGLDACSHCKNRSPNWCFFLRGLGVTGISSRNNQRKTDSGSVLFDTDLFRPVIPYRNRPNLFSTKEVLPVLFCFAGKDPLPGRFCNDGDLGGLAGSLMSSSTSKPTLRRADYAKSRPALVPVNVSGFR